MCGIAGFFIRKNIDFSHLTILKNMVASLKHRGPDEFGVYINQNVGLGQSRLSIIDLAGGSQPIHNEDRTIWIVYNGEVFNYVELREELEKKGHQFYTRTDTEVMVHLYEEHGPAMLDRLNGQFAFCIYDLKAKKLFLARDHIGILPLFYTYKSDIGFVFGSEIKSILAYPGISARIDPTGLAEVFVFWANLPGNTVFRDIYELEPGYYLEVTPQAVKKTRYWDIPFRKQQDLEGISSARAKQELYELLNDASAIRLRADVPVAAYLSGGIDSSIVAALIKKYHNRDLVTFSVGFSDEAYDERKYQQIMREQLQTRHFEAVVDYQDIARLFAELVWYAERPTFRTAPAPLFALSGLVRENRVKVVLTGEGADESFGGYNIFKEAKIRHFMARNPSAEAREKLLFSLYPYIRKDPRAAKYWAAFFRKNLHLHDDVLFSHLLRWGNGLFTLQFMSTEWQNQFNYDQKLEQLRQLFPTDAGEWHPLNRAQYLEMKLFLPGYLLATQGDRMLMAHSVEGRFPYLDKRVIEFAAGLPNYLKIAGLKEKHILKLAFRNEIPDEILFRPKQPYRAPIYRCFVGEAVPEYISFLLRESTLHEFGIFDAEKVGKLLKKAEKSGLNEKEEMALVNVVSSQILYDQFEKSRKPNATEIPLVKIYQ